MLLSPIRRSSAFHAKGSSQSPFRLITPRTVCSTLSSKDCPRLYGVTPKCRYRLMKLSYGLFLHTSHCSLPLAMSKTLNLVRVMKPFSRKYEHINTSTPETDLQHEPCRLPFSVAKRKKSSQRHRKHESLQGRIEKEIGRNVARGLQK